MDSRTLQIFIAVFVGAFLGAMIGLEGWAQPIALLPMTVSILSGGAIGYLIYDGQKVLAALRFAAKAIINPRHRKQWKMILACLGVSAGLIGSPWIASHLYALAFPSQESLGFLLDSWISFIPLAYGLGIITAYLLAAFYIFFALLWNFNERDKEDLLQLGVIAMIANPIVLPLVLPFISMAAVGIFGVTITLLFALGLWKIGQFTALVFKTIHSNERLLVGVDAAIGSAIGVTSGNAILGALIGGLWGVANFELFSKRILHLVPVHSKERP